MLIPRLHTSGQLLKEFGAMSFPILQQSKSPKTARDGRGRLGVGKFGVRDPWFQGLESRIPASAFGGFPVWLLSNLLEASR